MSGKPWTPERKAEHAKRMKARWRNPTYRKSQSTKNLLAMADAQRRAAASERMKRLNEQMRSDEALKKKCVAGMTRSRRDPAYRAIQSLVMTETMARPALREIARQHACVINRDPDVRERQWAGRRRKLLEAAAPPPFAEEAKTPPVKNLSVRIRPRQPSVKLPRKRVDYSAGGYPCRADPPIAVGSDPLLQRLVDGQR